MIHQFNKVTAEEAISKVKSGDRVFIQGAAMTPFNLIDALVSRYESLEDVEIMHLHTKVRQHIQKNLIPGLLRSTVHLLVEM